MSEHILKSIDEKMKLVVRLLALDLIKGRPLNQQIELLYNASMSTAEIAAVLGRTPNNIRVQLHLMKKKAKHTD